MKKFDVEITETLQRKVSVEAASQEDAERMVTQAWNNQDYVLDSGDFTGVDFKTVGEHEMAETRTMNVLLVQPNAYPKKISVGTELEDLQAMVGGDIEVTYPFEDEVAIILNESGKINGLPLNRAIYTEDGDMVAHRLYTVTGADQLVVVNQGRIEATGTHEELLKKCPLYKEMWLAHIGSRDEGGATA